VLEGVIPLETFPLRSGTKENLQMYRVSPCYKRKSASSVRNVLSFLDHTQRRTTVGRTPLDE